MPPAVDTCQRPLFTSGYGRTEISNRPRVIGLVGKPASVWRNDAVPLAERGLHERRHTVGPVQLDLHDILHGFLARLQ